MTTTVTTMSCLTEGPIRVPSGRGTDKPGAQHRHPDDDDDDDDNKPVWPLLAVGALFRRARCIHINRVLFRHVPSSALRSPNILVMQLDTQGLDASSLSGNNSGSLCRVPTRRERCVRSRTVVAARWPRQAPWTNTVSPTELSGTSQREAVALTMVSITMVMTFSQLSRSTAITERHDGRDGSIVKLGTTC